MKKFEKFDPSIDEIMKYEDIDTLVGSICANYVVERPSRGRGKDTYARERDLIASIRAMCSLFKEVVVRANEQKERAEGLERRVEILEKELRKKHSNEHLGGASTSSMADSQLFTTKLKSNVVNAVVSDLKERQTREKNIVIYGLAEPIESGEDSSAKDKDRTSVENVLKIVGINTENIKIHRLKSNKKPSPVVVELVNKTARDEALRGAKVLRENEQFNGIYINPDLTLAERIEAKELRDERNRLNKDLKDKKENGNEQIDYYYVVRRGKVVKWHQKATESNVPENNGNNK